MKNRIVERQLKVCKRLIQYNIKYINGKIQKSKISFKNKKPST